MFANEAPNPDKTSLFIANYALMSMEDELPPMAQQNLCSVLFQDFERGNVLVIMRVHDSSLPISWVNFTEIKYAYIIEEASRESILINRLGPPPDPPIIPNPENLSQTLQDQVQFAANSNFNQSFYSSYPDVAHCILSESFQGAFALSRHGWSRLPDRIKLAKIPNDIPLTFPGLTKRSYEDLRTDNQLSSSNNPPGIRLSTGSVEREERIRVSTMGLCRFFNTRSYKKDPRIEHILGPSLDIKSAQCHLMVLGLIDNENMTSFPALASTSMDLLLNMKFSADLRVPTTGVPTYLHPSCFMKPAQDGQYFKFHEANSLYKATCNIQHIYNRIALCAGSALPSTITKGEPMFNRIFAQVRDVLSNPDVDGIKLININWLTLCVAKIYQEVGKMFTSVLEGKLTEDEFIDKAILTAQLDIVKIAAKGETAQKAVPDQFSCNLFVGKKLSLVKESKENFKDLTKAKKLKIDTSHKKQSDKDDSSPDASLKVCSDHLAKLVGIRQEECSRGTSCPFEHLDSINSGDKKRLIKGMMFIKNEAFRKLIIQKINEYK